MNSVITLISSQSSLNESTVSLKLRSIGISIERQSRLSRNKAIELYCQCDSVDALANSIDGSLNGFFSEQHIDWIVQPAGNRRKKMLITDMDSTIIQCECIDELADMVGLKDRVAKITEAAMNGEIDFPAALRERVALLKGLQVEKLQRVLDERVRLTSGAVELVSTMRDHGALCVLVSGGFTFFTEPIARRCGFHFHHACQLEIKGSVLTGEAIGEIVDKHAKLRYLTSHQNESGLTNDDILAIGDGANDIPMLEVAGLGVAFHGKEKVNRAVKNHIRFNDLRAVLYAQGYPDEDIVSLN